LPKKAKFIPCAGVVDSLERENLVLKEQSSKLQEQVTLLEKRLASQQQDWHSSRKTIAALKRELKQLRGECVSAPSQQKQA